MFQKESISGFHDFKQKNGQRTNSWSEWGKNLPIKWLKIVNVPIFNQIILKLFNWSIRFDFSEKILAVTISNISKVRENYQLEEGRQKVV